MKATRCPKCGSETVRTLGKKRSQFYPAGCLLILGQLLCSIHQAQSQIEYECEDCQERFGRRSLLAKAVVVAAILVFVFWLSVIVFQSLVLIFG